jgi:hypothetical protein
MLHQQASCSRYDYKPISIYGKKSGSYYRTRFEIMCRFSSYFNFQKTRDVEVYNQKSKYGCDSYTSSIFVFQCALPTITIKISRLGLCL